MPKNQETKILLNCDMGESYGPWNMGHDQTLMPHIHQANIACGFHASDPLNMDRCIKLAKQHHVYIGAHPGYQDLLGFGRRSIPHSAAELQSHFLYQIGAINSLCEANEVQLSYVKPHGALYNDMMKDEQIFKQLINALSKLASPLALMIQAGPKQEYYTILARTAQIELIYEAFIDRRYQEDGNLVPRTKDGAVLSTEAELLAQAQQLKQGHVSCNTGKSLEIKAQSLCIHGDNLAAIACIDKISQLFND